ncbi:MAG TPA: YwiC-like family protein [Vicinamibacterales bacterium]|nr:YwiC-like family protein [Vicinamibacterales bacterium]
MLTPREHGAYGQLLFPLVSALLIGHPAAGAYLLAATAVALFLAHEALLVVLGQRGARASRELGADARRTLALFGAFFVVTGGVSLVVIPRLALWFVLLPVVLGLAVFAVVIAHRERSTSGESLVAMALSSVSVPVALAGTVPRAAALTLFVVFAGVFVTATVAVRSMIGRVSKVGGPPPALSAALSVAVVSGLAVAAVSGRLPPVAPYAAMPVCAIALALAVRPPSPRHLRAIGWTLVGATALTAVMLVSALA